MIAAVLTSILPVCLLVALGALLNRSRFLPDAFFTQLNRLGFWLLLPCLLFCTIARAPEQTGGTGLRIGLLLGSGLSGTPSAASAQKPLTALLPGGCTVRFPWHLTLGTRSESPQAL